MDNRLVLLYAAIGILLVFQGFTHAFTDYPVELIDNFLLAEGKTPYVDFFEHHPVFQNYLLSPVLWLLNPATAFVVYHVLGLIGVAVCAWLVYRIAAKNKFANPHVASLFFLVGYTGLISPFLRYEFWSMFFLLGFFAFSHPFARGLFITFLGATSPIVFFAAGAMAAVYYVTTFLKDKKAAFISLAGSVMGVLFWLLLHRDVPLDLMYRLIVTFNSSIGHLYAVSWQEATFFTFIFVLPVLALALMPMLKAAKSKNEFAVLGLVFTAVFVLQIITMNFVYGPFSRIKLPAPIPILALAVIFLATHPKKFGYLLVAGQVLLTLFAYTPSFALPELDMASAISTLDRCVAPDARMMFTEEYTTRMHVPIFREPNDYYWFLREYYDEAGVNTPPPNFNNPLTLCGNTIEASAWTCGSAELDAMKQTCKGLLVPNTFWLETRAYITGRSLPTR